MGDKQTQSTSEILEYIRSDLYRNTGHTDWACLLRNLFSNQAVCYCFWFRFCRSDNPIIAFFSKRMHNHLGRRYSIQIPWDTKVGYGLFLGHHMCVVVNATATLGDNVNLSQFSTIGSNDGISARIGNSVYLGPSVTVVGDISIGDGVTVGAGAVVTRDIPAEHTAVGSPAKAQRSSEPARYIQNPWPPVHSS